jgi:1-deoxy-D-xylulose-5-phosphate synthase
MTTAVPTRPPVALEHALRRSAALGRSVLVHWVTTKGKGYPPAEQDQADHLHTIPASGSKASLTWTDVFGDEILAIGEQRPVEILRAHGLDAAGIAAAILKRVKDDSTSYGEATRTVAP